MGVWQPEGIRWNALSGAAAAPAQTYGSTRSPKSLIASMILSCAGPPE